ncbi:MAG: hypothetical protein L0I24_16640 [Pseudonocardia sp.]|nr:hypothetical protein [Pseudonocardia sp.]
MPLWRARALLRPWWDAGTCPAALLHAIDHHPDRPDHHRGDALRGAHDPLRSLGARLRPWRGRLHELPTKLAGIPGDYRTRPQAPLAASSTAPNTTTVPPGQPPTAAQRSAQAAVRDHLAQLRASRRSNA